MLLVSLPWRAFRGVFACFAALSLTVTALFAQTPSALDGFEPNVDGNVYAIAVQPDGKILVGGQFQNFRTRDGLLIGRTNLARLNADGSLDNAFNPAPNGPVRALVVQGDGNILIGGDFTTLQPGGTGAPVARSCFARLTSGGTVDTVALNLGGALIPGTTATLRPQVFVLSPQPDGALIVGGSFGSVQPGNLTVIFTRNNLFRVLPTGAVDTAWNPNPNNAVLAVVPHIDGKVVVAGGFTSFQEAQRPSATVRNRIARLNRDGTLDSEFNPNANNAVDTLAVQRDGKIILAGHFTTLQPPSDTTVANRNHIARLNPNGTLDSEFYPNANGPIVALGVQADGSIIIAGAFSIAWGRGTSSFNRANVARFNPDGSIDSYFNPGLNAQVDAVAFQSDGKVILGGHFTRALPAGSVATLVRNHLARFNVDGSVDAAFELAAGGRVLTTAVQADGRVIVGGSFTTVSGATHNYLARLNADGTVDGTYTPNLNGAVYATTIDASGKLLAGGVFTTVTHARTGTDNRNRLARFNADGTPDSEFNPNLDGQVSSIAVQSDGKILVGGSFSTVQPIGATEVTARANLLRLNANGTLDTAFNPTPNGPVSAVVVLADGKILAAGSFSVFIPNAGTTSVSRNALARLNVDGTVDTAFDPALIGAPVSALAVQSDGKIVIGGGFFTVTPKTALEATTRNRIARLNADGTLDTTYNPNANGSVMALALQADGKLIVGGAFTTFQPNGASDWTLRRYAARLNADGTLDNTFNLDIDEGGGHRVDSLRLLSNGQLLLGGNFSSLQSTGANVRVERPGFARVITTGASATLDPTFAPGTGGAAGGTINALAVQANNKVIAVGLFTDVGGAKTTNVARFNAEGGADLSFGTSLSTVGNINAVVVRPVNTLLPSTLGGFAWLNPNGTLRTNFTPGSDARVSGRVNTAVVDASGRLIVGGTFSNLSNATGGNLARFNANGSLDTSFNPAPNGAVTGIVVQPDGKLVIVGSFSTIASGTRNNIARLNADGTLDANFNPNAGGRINAIVRESDGRLIVGGAFATFSPNNAAEPTSRAYLARINTDGTLDAYAPTPNSTVQTLVIQSDGKVVAGGAFTSVQPNSGASSFTRNYMARFNTDGSLDQNFDPNFNNAVNAIVALPNGQFVVGGAFSALQPTINAALTTLTLRSGLARVNSDGAIDTTFDPNPNGIVNGLALQSDGAVLVTGAFTSLQPAGTTTAITRNHVARVTNTGSLDLDFNPDVNGDAVFVAVRPDNTILLGGDFSGLQASGAIVIGGSFTTVTGVDVPNLAAVNDNGTVNTNFRPRPNGAVTALLVQADGKLVVGGAFTTIAGANRNRIARLNADGTIDSTLAGGLGSNVTALALQSDGKIVVGGRSVAGSLGGIFRFNADGSLDASFATVSAGLGVPVLAVQADNKILAVVEGSGIRHTLLRYNADGTPDTTFTPVQNASGSFDAIALQADGRILIGGDFSALGTSSVARLARLNANGTVDATFNPAPNGRVTALAQQADGRTVLGGAFTTVGGLPRVGIARVATTGPATQALVISPDRRTITWVRGGTATELAAATFEQSADRATWVSIGAGTRASGTGNWQVGALALPQNTSFYIRARGVAPSDGTSSGVVELVGEFNFANPLGGPGLATTIAIAGSAAAPDVAALWSVDPVSGIGAQTAVQSTTDAGTFQSTVEIVVNAATAPAPNGAAWLSNLSTRGRVNATSPLVVGFAVSGSSSRMILVRGIGPSLATFGVSDAATATRLEVLDAGGRVVVTASGWDVNASSEVLAAFARTGAFPLPGRTADSAALLTLAPGTYTLQVSSTQGAGTALAEIYDADTTSNRSRLLNVSTRGTAASGSGALIGGFVISGNTSRRMLLRGAGPALNQFGLGGTLADPMIALFDAAGRQLGVNDNWVSAAPQMTAAGASVGAFAFPADSRDAGVLATLPPGAYTVQLTPSAAASATTGTALLEIYELP